MNLYMQYYEIQCTNRPRNMRSAKYSFILFHLLCGGAWFLCWMIFSFKSMRTESYLHIPIFMMIAIESRLCTKSWYRCAALNISEHANTIPNFDINLCPVPGLFMPLTQLLYFCTYQPEKLLRMTYKDATIKTNAHEAPTKERKQQQQQPKKKEVAPLSIWAVRNRCNNST